MIKNILFVTGTRADYGKIKPLLQAVSEHKDFNLKIFCTGMHLIAKYGLTINEIYKSGYSNITFPYINQTEGDNMECILSNTIRGLSYYLDENETDLIIIHGDRVEALASAITGALRNVLVGHIEGGELSGTIDDLIRHSTSKMAHAHFVANEKAKKRLIQMGENAKCIYQIGSPDIDVMSSGKLPSLEDCKNRYGISFTNYAIAILHPVTTEQEKAGVNASLFYSALKKSKQNFIIIYPNNDTGTDAIMGEINALIGNKRFLIFPSIRFEYFLSLLKNAEYIIGNSSAGIHEAPVFGVPTIDLGTRQMNRFKYDSIFNIPFNESEILETIKMIEGIGRFEETNFYGSGNSASKFITVLESKEFWNIKVQKSFVDLYND